MRHDPRETFIQLFAIAEGQGGYFTAEQAKSAGYSYRLQHYHVSRGNWLKIGRAVFRLRAFPLGEREDLIRWNFWSLGRGVISHDSALEFHGIGDVIPDRIHLTVPLGFRKQEPGVVLHRGEVAPVELENHAGFRVTTPVRTMVDVADSDLDPDRFYDAVGQAVSSGRVRRTQLLQVLPRLTGRGQKRLEAALKEAEAA